MTYSLTASVGSRKGKVHASGFLLHVARPIFDERHDQSKACMSRPVWQPLLASGPDLTCCPAADRDNGWSGAIDEDSQGVSGSRQPVVTPGPGCSRITGW